jgi:hypothetical protein
MKLPPGVHFEDPLIVLEQSREQMGALSQVELFASAGVRYQKLKEVWCAGVSGIGYGRFVSPCRVAVNDSELRTDADFFFPARQLERDAVVAAAGKFEGHFASVWIVTSLQICTIHASDSLGCIPGWGPLVDLPSLSLADLQG